ncbi:MAG: chemotaxis-specific protein-glutamate methyltransferase CheB [Pseudobdellovibrionaceae bacterium]
MEKLKVISIIDITTFKIYSQMDDCIFLKSNGTFLYCENQSKENRLIYFKSINEHVLNESILEIKSQLKSDLDKIVFKLISLEQYAVAIKQILDVCKIKPQKMIFKDFEYDLIYQSKKASIKISKSIETQSISKTEDDLKKIKVLIVDDSKTIRQLLSSILSEDTKIDVVALAEKPSEVEGLILKYQPDVITLDIHMPEMDGVTLLKKIMPKYKIPTIMISSISKEEGPQVLNALEAGAVDYIQKPSMKDLDIAKLKIIESVKMASQAKVIEIFEPTITKHASAELDFNKMIVIGSSTGGTEALRVILQSLPERIPPILIVQHIPAVFSTALAHRLDTLCEFEVREAVDGDIPRPGLVLIAPGGKQMGLSKKGSELKISVNDTEPVNRHKPSVDYLFHQVADLKLKNIIGCILTGMGADGAKGLLQLRNNGARTIAQDKNSCVVFGMPREAIELGAAEFISPLNRIAEKLIELSKKQTEISLKRTGTI